MKASAEVQFAQRLAANDKQDRDKAVKKLRKWFSSRSSGSTPFQEDELLRVWKGLFYCYWMSDKPLIQEELAVSIASMIDGFGSEESTLLFIKTFLLTMNREWFGIDKWRMDKFMMMTRRFIRQVFKYNKKKSWNEELTTKIRDILSENLIISKTDSVNLGFQMHVTDVFLEELAKVGGEDLDRTVIDLYLQPFIQVLATGREQRFRNHVVERIFHYLLRQSDCGIEWEMEKEVEALGNVELLNEVDEDEGEDGAEEVEDDEEMDAEEAPVNGTAEDPRAGRVDVELPQLKIDYQQISKELFELGSKENIKVANRNTLYKLSKFFKDVGNDVFPLGDTLSDEEPDEKIDIKAAVNKALEKEEKIRKKNLKTKEEYKKLKKMRPNNGLDNGSEFVDAVTEQIAEDRVDLKRKKDEDDVDDEPEEVKKARIEENKLKKKEKEKKRKQKLKREKREKLLAEKIKEGEEKRKAELLLAQDIELKSALDLDKPESKKNKKKNKEGKQKENKMNGHTQEAVVSPENTEQKIKKKKKKKNAEEENNHTESSKKEEPKKKKKNADKENDQIKIEQTENTPDTSLDITNSSVIDSTKKKKKKKKDKSEGGDNKLSNFEVVSNNGHAKLFDEPSDWDSPLLPGEQEIVLPSKKYKGDEKLAPPAASPGFPEFDSPTVSTPKQKKSHTAVFLKKALSKSATPKKKRLETGVMKKDLSSSEPRPKKVNFALTRNMSQEISDLYTSIASSPGIPHDPNKNPEKSLLKRKMMARDRESELQPVQLNTQLNSLSSKGKKLMGKKQRMQAKEFFLMK